MTEQTLRERLAEVRFRQMAGITDDDVLRGEPILVQEHVYEEVDMYLAVIREWLESEAVSKPLYVAPEGTPYHEAYVEGWQSCLVRLKALAQSLGGPND